MENSYKKIISIIDDVDEDVRDRIFKGLDEIVYQPRELNVRDIATLTKLRREHKIEVSVNVTNRSKIKTQLAYQFNGDIAFLEDERQDLRPTAKKQFELLMFIMGHLEEVWVKKTLQEIISVSDAILNQGTRRPSMNTTNKLMKTTEGKRLEISLRKLEIAKEYFIQRWGP